MSVMPMLLALLAGLSVFLFLGPGGMPGRMTRLGRIYAQLGSTAVASARTRASGPWVRKLPLRRLTALLSQVLTRRYRSKVERWLRIARMDQTHTYEDILGMKLTFALACASYGLLMALKRHDLLLGGFLGVLALMGFLYPDNWLANKAKRRQEAVERELPSFLSALAVALEAGLSLMAAVAEVARDRQGVLATELGQAADWYERGMTPAEALGRIAVRLEVPELTVALTGLVQAFTKGSNHMVTTVRRQATESWQRRKRRAESLAQTASVKLFLPIALLALPGFMIFLLGPAVLEIIDYILR